MGNLHREVLTEVKCTATQSAAFDAVVEAAAAASQESVTMQSQLNYRSSRVHLL